MLRRAGRASNLSRALARTFFPTNLLPTNLPPTNLLLSFIQLCIKYTGPPQVGPAFWPLMEASGFSHPVLARHVREDLTLGLPAEATSPNLTATYSQSNPN